MNRFLAALTLQMILELPGSTSRFAESSIPADECPSEQLSPIGEAL